MEVLERQAIPVDEIQLTDAFMQRKVAEILGGGEADPLGAYLRINGEVRKQNADQIRKISEKSSEDPLWRGPFKQLPNSKVGARFAEHRTYYHNGGVVDRQIHLGYDLASTQNAPVPTANDGIVVFADDLGIYGNTVIVDHGLGLFSLYGHLTSIGTKKGQPVHKGDILGHTGTTGLAGGDHLHFSMILSGVFVDPLEWFDARWIQEHITPKLAIAKVEPST